MSELKSLTSGPRELQTMYGIYMYAYTSARNSLLRDEPYSSPIWPDSLTKHVSTMKTISSKQRNVEGSYKKLCWTYAILCTIQRTLFATTWRRASFFHLTPLAKWSKTMRIYAQAKRNWQRWLELIAKLVQNKAKLLKLVWTEKDSIDITN